MVYNWLKFTQRLLYPPHCVLCGRTMTTGRDICRGCLESLPVNSSACSRCGHPLTRTNGVCASCLKHPPYYRASFIPFRYASPVDHLLQQLKFHQRLYLAVLLGELLADSLERRGDPLPECLLPVPLHSGRVSERGYNQALELARVVSDRLGVPIKSGLCQRVRATSPQTSLDGEQRRRNLRGAFVVRGENLPQHVAIIDDVVTTGTTVNEMAKALRRAGVKAVEVWACARAGKICK